MLVLMYFPSVCYLLFQFPSPSKFSVTVSCSDFSSLYFFNVTLPEGEGVGGKGGMMTNAPN